MGGKKRALYGATCIGISWHRYYDPSTGRYLSPDPIGLAGGINPYLYSNANPINYIDPFGLWGEDVHSGVGNSSYGTYTWAQQAGFASNQAELISRGNQGTDGGFGSWQPILGLQQRHFNQLQSNQRPYTDSRLYWAYKELRRAVAYYQEGDCEAAYGHLGRGLHSLQDLYAHRDWDTGWHGFDPHPGWYDDWSDSRNRSARQQTADRSIQYLNLFRSLTGQ